MDVEVSPDTRKPDVLVAEPVDVLLPFYGDVAQFRQAVDSVLSQSYGDFTLICVDDCYPSFEPRDWLLSLKDPRVRYVRNEVNLGVARNFNRCLELASAPRFVMIGGDDVMLADYLETVMRIAGRHPDAVVIQPGVEVIDEAGRPVRPLPDRIKAMIRPRVDGAERVLRGEQLAVSLTRADWAYFPSLLWSTQAARRHGFDEQYAIALDLALLLDLALDGGALVITDDVCFRYRRHSSSVSSAGADDGIRFAQERALLDDYAARFSRVGWNAAAGVARRKFIPRLSAGSSALSAALAGRPRDSWRLLRYVFG